MEDVLRLTARQAVDLLRDGKVSPLELVDAAAARIEAVDGDVNALPTRCYDRARDHARRLMEQPPRDRGPLAGLPLVIPNSARSASSAWTSTSTIALPIPTTSRVVSSIAVIPTVANFVRAGRSIAGRSIDRACAPARRHSVAVLGRGLARYSL